jgi:hypothetical protein
MSLRGRSSRCRGLWKKPRWLISEWELVDLTSCGSYCLSFNEHNEQAGGVLFCYIPLTDNPRPKALSWSFPLSDQNDSHDRYSCPVLRPNI